MHITLSSDALAAMLKSSVATANSPISILTNARIATEADGRVSLLTTDTEAYVQAFADAEIHAPGAVCLPVHLMRPACAQPGTVTIKGSAVSRGRSRYALAEAPANDFPQPDHPNEPWQPLHCDPVALAKAFAAAGYAANPGDIRPAYRAVTLSGGLVYSTDGKAGCYREIEYTGPDISINPAQLERILPLLAEGTELSVGNVQYGRAAMLRVATRSMVVTVRLVDTPPLPQVRVVFDREIPGAIPNRMHVARLRALLRNFLPFSELAAGIKVKWRRIEIMCDGERLELRNAAGDAVEALDEALEGAPGGSFRVGFQPHYVLKALEAIDTPLVDVLASRADAGTLTLIPVDEGERRSGEVHVIVGLRA